MKIVKKNELRRYMGSKHAQIPRGAVVRLIAINGKSAVFEWSGNRYVSPVRLLWKIRDRRED